MEGISKNQIKHIRSLQQKKFRQLDGEFVVEGPKLVAALLESKFTVKRVIYSSEEFSSIYSQASQVPAKVMEQCSSLKSPPGVLAVASIPNPEPLAFDALNLILDGIKDPGNLGTIIRSASWFGVERIILTDDCVDPFNPKVVQSTMGALFDARISFGTRDEIATMIGDWEGTSAIADMAGENSSTIEWLSPLNLIIGGESHGVSSEFRNAANLSVAIENKGRGESLNAAVAASILLSQISSSV